MAPLAPLRFQGSQNFRQRILFATLSGKTVEIANIREQDVNPGVRDYEVSFLKLLVKLSNGCKVTIDATGTCVRYKPGVIVGGSGLEHKCGTSRSIGWFMEPVIILALWAKKALSITLTGVTNDRVDVGVDVFRTVTLPLLKRLGVDDSGLELKIIKRGARPNGGGEVMLRVPFIKQLPPIHLADEGMVKRIRGVAYSHSVSPQNTNRMVDGARGPLNDFLADVYIFTDASSGARCGKSPGFGIALVAETTSGCLISSEACAAAGKRAHDRSEAAADEVDEEALIDAVCQQQLGGSLQADAMVVPEDVGRAAAQALLKEVQRGGVVDSSHQSMLLTLCALGPQEVNKVRLGALTPQAVRTLRHIKDFFGVVFNMQTEKESQTVFLSCVGCGLRNIARRTY